MTKLIRDYFADLCGNIFEYVDKMNNLVEKVNFLKTRKVKQIKVS